MTTTTPTPRVNGRWRTIALLVTCALAILGGSNLQAAAPDPDTATTAVTAAATGAEPQPVATVEHLTIYSPVIHTPTVGFHEASYPAAVPMEPVTPDVTDDRYQLIMPTRDRPTAPTSALDIAAPPGHPLVSPVTGTVVNVEEYELYGTHPDVRVDIAPAGHPDLTVTILHVTGPQVHPGDLVLAGRTPLADQGTALPFTSQIDRYTPEVGAHLHIEVQRR